MIREDLNLTHGDLYEVVLPRLLDRVFHVSLLSNLDSILKSGAIRPGCEVSAPSSYGYQKASFFRKRGCVSLFDYRSVSTTELAESMKKCSPFQPAVPGTSEPGNSVFILSPDHCADLLPWTLWEEEEARNEMVVPKVEAGHKGPILLEHLDELLAIEIEHDSELVSQVRALWNGREKAAARNRQN